MIHPLWSERAFHWIGSRLRGEGTAKRQYLPELKPSQAGNAISFHVRGLKAKKGAGIFPGAERTREMRSSEFSLPKLI
jgi:hypothetical protein